MGGGFKFFFLPSTLFVALLFVFAFLSLLLSLALVATAFIVCLALSSMAACNCFIVSICVVSSCAVVSLCVASGSYLLRVGTVAKYLENFADGVWVSGSLGRFCVFSGALVLAPSFISASGSGMFIVGVSAGFVVCTSFRFSVCISSGFVFCGCFSWFGCGGGGGGAMKLNVLRVVGCIFVRLA